MKQHDQKQLIEELILAYGSRGLRVHRVKEAWPQAVWLQEQKSREITSSSSRTKERVNGKLEMVQALKIHTQ